MAIEFKSLNAANLGYQHACSQVSDEANDFIAFMRQNRFKDLYSDPKAYYDALECEEGIQQSLPSDLEQYPLPEFVRDRTSARAASTQDGHKYLVLSPKGEDSARTVMYACGGGFMSQPMEAHWDMVCYLAQELTCKVAIPLHPLLPDSHYEQAKEYLLAVYRDVLADSADVVLAGDSSGGWCAMATALWAKELGLGQPGYVVLVSPLLDLSGENAKIREALAQHDEMLSPWGVAEAGRLWTPKFCDRMAWPPSPAFACLQDIAPVDVVIGSNEMLIADLRLLQGTAAADRIRVAVYPGMWHAFPLFSGFPESKDARCLIVESIRRHWAGCR